MGEVTITCLGDTAIIPDLGLALGRGQQVKVRWSLAQKSLDLPAARDLGIVSTKVESMTTLPTDNTLLIARSAASPFPQAVEAPREVSDIREAMREISEELRSLRRDLQSRVDSPLDLDLLSQKICSLMAQTSSLPQVVEPTPVVDKVHEDTPLFIPDNLTKGGGKVSLKETTGGATEGLDAAVAKLKKSKKVPNE